MIGIGINGFEGQRVALRRLYAAGGLNPPFLVDFARERARVNSAASDFANALTFTRSGSATYVDSTGTLQTAADGEPRMGHHVWDGSQWVNEGLLIESESRTNFLTYSEDFTDAGWSKGGVSQVALNETGPDGGTNSAVTLSDDNSGGTGPVLIFEAVTVSTSTTYTFSCFAKKGGLSWVVLRGEGFTTPSNGGVYFNLNDGTIGTELSGFSGEIEDFGNGWYRCSISFTTDSSDTSGAVVIRPATGDGNLTVDLDGTSSILIYGAQFEQGSTPSSYIPAAGSTVTRGAETLTAPSANLPWSSDAISIAMEGLETYADEGTAGQVTLYDRRVDASNRITLTLDTDSTKTGTFTLTVVNGGSTETISTTGEITPGINKPFNLAFVATSTELGIALNGTAETRVSHTLGLPDLSGADATYEGMGARTLVREWADDVDEADASS